MNRIPVVWVETPDEDDDDDLDRSITFRLRGEWCSVDRDQLVLPITLLERNGQEIAEPEPALLMQYGGEGLLNDLLLETGGEVEAGQKYLLQHTEGMGRTLTLVEN